MGAYLSTPKREKDSFDYKNDRFSYGASSMQGWRVSQEVIICIALCYKMLKDCCKYPWLVFHILLQDF